METSIGSTSSRVGRGRWLVHNIYQRLGSLSARIFLLRAPSWEEVKKNHLRDLHDRILIPEEELQIVDCLGSKGRAAYWIFESPKIAGGINLDDDLCPRGVGADGRRRNFYPHCASLPSYHAFILVE
ncbi:hypothetical protein F0562_030739 [Nyssa sinensis]|uniref:Uncharacterized protein n=1 Tax=Nyssa sinensis TaxID=561372 RepID=A0A5J5AZE8_9ASTE|nr:hypothetical protein F0562_030739 [Nyssa sinensis]